VKQLLFSTSSFLKSAPCLAAFFFFISAARSQTSDTSKTNSVSHTVDQVNRVIKPSEHYLDVEIGGSFYVNSDAITTEFFNTFYQGGFISNEKKDRCRKKLHYSNRIGGDADYGISANWKPDSLFHKSNLSMNIALKDRFHYDAGFSRDFFNVVMYGNKMYAGSTADLGNFTLNLLRYQQVKVGLEWEGDTAHGSYGLSASFLKGEKNVMVDAGRAGLTTSADGSNIDLDLAMLMRRTDTSRVGPMAFNGCGFSTDFYYEMPYLTWYNEGLLRVEVNDLGFIRWNTHSNYYKVDSVYHYDGVQINNILDLQNNALPQNNPDSLVKKNIKYGTEPYTTVLPAVFTVAATTYYGKRFAWEKGMRFRMKSNCRPYYYSAFTWYATKKFSATVTAAYGGYGNFNAGMELEFLFPGQVKLHLDSYYLTGYLLPQKCSAQGVTLSLSKRF
jgi:hypothetical protein